MAGTSTAPVAVIKRLHQVMNRRDLEAMLECFDPDYDSYQPVHPAERFKGRDQVRKNWSAIFKAVPDFQAELLRTASEGDEAWSEWHWHGTRADGKVFDVRGVLIAGIRGARIAWARLYIEQVEAAGIDIDEAVQDLTGTT
jgi:ketosteroid isomerase-like protein